VMTRIRFPIIRPLTTARSTAPLLSSLSTDEAYLSREPVSVNGVELGNVRTLVVVPMLKDEEVIGGLGHRRDMEQRLSGRCGSTIDNPPGPRFVW